jgi:hypothetical protein
LAIPPRLGCSASHSGWLPAFSTYSFPPEAPPACYLATLALHRSAHPAWQCCLHDGQLLELAFGISKTGQDVYSGWCAHQSLTLINQATPLPALRSAPAWGCHGGRKVNQARALVCLASPVFWQGWNARLMLVIAGGLVQATQQSKLKEPRTQNLERRTAFAIVETASPHTHWPIEFRT